MRIQTESSNKAPLDARESAGQKRRNAQPASHSAPPRVTLGQLLRGAFLIAAALLYVDAPAIKAWVQQSEPEQAGRSVDFAPVAAIPAPNQAASPENR